MKQKADEREIKTYLSTKRHWIRHDHVIFLVISIFASKVAIGHGEAFVHICVYSFTYIRWCSVFRFCIRDCDQFKHSRPQEKKTPI